MSFFPNFDPVFIETILCRMVPCFLIAACGNVEAARQAAKSLLSSYNVATEEELGLATEIACFGLGALEALSQSMDPDLPLKDVLRLRGSANAQHRSGYQCQRTLDKLRKERRIAAAGDRQTVKAQPAIQSAAAETPNAAMSIPAQVTLPPQAALPTQAASIAPASIQPAVSQPKTDHPPAEANLSRQQRRALERSTEKARRSQAGQDRRQAMRMKVAGGFASTSPFAGTAAAFLSSTIQSSAT